jgi:branched-chain amino acid transport system ATP-binding protein
MTQTPAREGGAKILGYELSATDAILSVDDIAAAASELGGPGPSLERLSELARGEPIVAVDDLVAGYGKMEILHGFSLRVGAGQALCIIGPNGAGKSTVLHSLYGFTQIISGTIAVKGRDVTRTTPNDKLKSSRVAYILQDSSVFPNMTVEENLLLGGFLKARPREAQQAADRIFDKYASLAKRRGQRASVLSGGERRLLEISRALIMDPDVLLVDEPSIGLEPRFIDMVFDILHELQHNEGKTIIMVEQNAKKGLEFADIGYVLVSGRIALAGSGRETLENPEVGRLFLGG